jgi:anti-sigma factor RsiW
MREMSCASCIDLGIDLTLNILSGPERAQVLAHVERCRRCKAHVLACARVVTRLRDLIPELEPPAGFEARVLNALRDASFRKNGRTQPIDTAARLRRELGGEVYDER